MNGSVVIVPYDSQWPILFAEERLAILVLMGGTIIEIEHIGGTAVPGMAAKPIVDMLAAVRQPRDFSFCIKQFQRLAYVYVPEYEDAFPERRFFYRGTPEAHTYHLHLVPYHSEFRRRHLRFRDLLRRNQKVAADYAEMKKTLAEKYRDDRQAYTDAKSAFIERCLQAPLIKSEEQ